MAGSGSIGTDAYTKMINDKLVQLDTRFAIDNQYTPLVGDYSGLRGGSRKKSHITPGISGTQYPLNYPESYAISAGAHHMAHMHPLMSHSHHAHHMVSPVNSVYPSALPMGRHSGTYTPRTGGRHSTKGSMSLTHPGQINYTTKKSSKVHHIGGHYVRSLPRPYVGGKHYHAPSLKQIGRTISRGAKKLGSEIKSDYHKASPIFKTVARSVLPTIGSYLGDAAGAALGSAVAPGAGTIIGSTLGSVAGSELGKYANRKIGLGRKKIPIHHGHHHHLQHISHPSHNSTPKRGGKRAPTARGEMIKKLMREHGMKLGEASSYIKQHGLY